MEAIKDEIFYTVVGFENPNKAATFYKDGYKRKGNAIRMIRKLIAKGFQQVMLRQENVWFRNESNEFSESSPIASYTPEGCQILN